MQLPCLPDGMTALEAMKRGFDNLELAEMIGERETHIAQMLELVGTLEGVCDGLNETVQKLSG